MTNMLKANYTRSIAESARNKIERELKAKKELEEKITQDFNKKLLVLFECALNGDTQFFFFEDEFTKAQLVMFSEAGFGVSYLKANHEKEADLRFRLNESHLMLDRLVNQLTDNPVIRENVFPGYIAAPSAFLTLLNSYWKSNKLSEFSEGRHFLSLLLKRNKIWEKELFEKSALLDQVVKSFSLAKKIEQTLKLISSENANIPDGLSSGILISWDSSGFNLDWSRNAPLSSSGLSWISSENGQLFIRKLNELISYQAHKGNLEVIWQLYDLEDRWLADDFDKETKDPWVDDLGMVHDDIWVDDLGELHYKKEYEDCISVPPPSWFAEILCLTGYKAEITWNPVPDEERDDENWDAKIAVSW